MPAETRPLAEPRPFDLNGSGRFGTAPADAAPDGDFPLWHLGRFARMLVMKLVKQIAYDIVTNPFAYVLLYGAIVVLLAGASIQR